MFSKGECSMNKVKTSINSVIGIIMIALSAINLIMSRLDYMYRPRSYIVFGIVYLIMTVCIAFFSIKYRNDANKVSKNFASFLPIIALVYLITLIFSFDLSIDHKTYSILYYEMLFAVTIIAVSMYKKVAINELLDFSVTTMLMAFVNSAVSGATGEEAGWRGFLQPQCVQKKGLVKGSVIVGIIWGFWHAPLWFISCEYVGIDLLKYILFFMIMIVSAAVIIGIVYEKNQNLLVPILIHFFVNFTIAFVKDYILDISMFLAAVYFVCALVMVMRVKR